MASFILRCGFLLCFAVGFFGGSVYAQEKPVSSEEPQPQFQATAPTPAAAADTELQAEDRSSKKTAGQETAGQEKEPTDRKTHIRLGTVSVGASYSHFSGPFFYPYGGYGYYPYGGWTYATLWDPIWAPYPFYGPGYFSRGETKGEVKLSAEPKKAAVYVDGGYAGTADQLRTMWIDPGAYDLSVTADGHQPFQQRIYVLSGKALKISARLTERKNQATEKDKDKDKEKP